MNQIIYFTGIAGGLVLILIEIFYKKHQLKRQRQLEVARHAADKWRQTIQQRKMDRSLDYQRRFKENGPPPFWAPGLDVRQRSPIAAKSNTIFV
ncbi:unnamed protein product [Allacma fusca]|uniref:Calmodulin-binding domain-containing protein n=1 Tax=Allacma fusca TaxID=39272 RepID=A0A8J2PMT9_9HEXA|nr:unnamed protein product [Allacma fusca]